MTTPKRKITLSLDGGALDELQASDADASLSSLVNDAVSDHVALLRQRRTLDLLVGEYEAEHGPLDEAKVQVAMERMQTQEAR